MEEKCLMLSKFRISLRYEASILALEEIWAETEEEARKMMNEKLETDDFWDDVIEDSYIENVHSTRIDNVKCLGTIVHKDQQTLFKAEEQK
jgi:hypothetical protein